VATDRRDRKDRRDFMEGINDRMNEGAARISEGFLPGG
jgi:hypothetical protein